MERIPSQLHHYQKQLLEKLNFHRLNYILLFIYH